MLARPGKTSLGPLSYKNLRLVKGLTVQISGGRAFQAAETGNTNILRWK